MADGLLLLSSETNLAAYLSNAVRLAPEEESQKLTGFVHNAVTCIGMETDIPVM
jgi:prolyl-tRNA editing enzyme YbaK/EbsC (Cys-tRNA(Pro) deacylase)